MNAPRDKIIPILLIVVVLIGAQTAGSNAKATKRFPRITAMSGTGQLTPQADTKPFTFVVFGDSQGEDGPPTLAAIYNDMKTLPDPKPAFAVSLGDIIVGEPTPPINTASIVQELNSALALAKGAGVPIFNAPGNHEMDDRLANYTEKPIPQMREAYVKVVAPAYGSFDYGNSHFIILNTEDLPPKGMVGPGPGKEFSYVGRIQLRQLKADLDANKDKTHVFVAMHYPIYAWAPAQDNLYGESRRALIDLFAKYSNISYVLASHEHQYYNPYDPNNVMTVPIFTAGGPTRYLISGGAGAPFWASQPGQPPIQPQPWAFHHYLLFEVNGATVTVTIERVNPKP
jgi:hypothetical protein